MDFNDTPEEAAFRAEARAWLDAQRGAARSPASARAGLEVRAEPGGHQAGAGVAGARRPTPAGPASPGRRSTAAAAPRRSRS